MSDTRNGCKVLSLKVLSEMATFFNALIYEPRSHGIATLGPSENNNITSQNEDLVKQLFPLQELKCFEMKNNC